MFCFSDQSGDDIVREEWLNETHYIVEKYIVKESSQGNLQIYNAHKHYSQISMLASALKNTLGALV